MKLIVGLGNPGTKFKNTKHNIGFEALDYFAQQNNLVFKSKHQSLFYKDNDFILLKPKTFMNLSGNAVYEVVKFYKINVKNILVIYDDATLPFGKIRTKANGSSGGHKGVEDIILKLGTKQFWRTKLGIGHNKKYSLSNWVLAHFSLKDQILKNNLIKSSSKIIDLFINNYKLKIMDKFN